ncbi:hypothetical protein [Dulcicalothrix desertica]|uniref:hypothetical protein n=1 Tax=Dulcicalothrix desertica TaxID=32056 RepID=UPI000F8CDCD5|nr:hypothetical protein [Dulcicalothrix desertica]
MTIRCVLLLNEQKTVNYSKSRTLEGAIFRSNTSNLEKNGNRDNYIYKNDVLDLSKTEAHQLKLYHYSVYLPSFIQGIV